jgi:hypothetical protein
MGMWFSSNAIELSENLREEGRECGLERDRSVRERRKAAVVPRNSREEQRWLHKNRGCVRPRGGDGI